MWVLAVDAAAVLLGLGLLAVLGWRVVLRPGLALAGAVSAAAARAGAAVTQLGGDTTDGHVADTLQTSWQGSTIEGIDVGSELAPGVTAGHSRGKV